MPRRTMTPAALLALLLPALPAAALDLDCRTEGYCTTLDMDCFPDDERFVLRERADGLHEFGWETSEIRFTAKPLLRGPLTIFAATGQPESIQTLVVAENLQATFSLSAVIGGELYTSFQKLTCTRR